VARGACVLAHDAARAVDHVGLVRAGVRRDQVVAVREHVEVTHGQPEGGVGPEGGRRVEVVGCVGEDAAVVLSLQGCPRTCIGVVQCWIHTHARTHGRRHPVRYFSRTEAELKDAQLSYAISDAVDRCRLTCPKMLPNTALPCLGLIPHPGIKDPAVAL
jgi:hypothetical protein